MENLQALGIEILDIAQKIFMFNKQNDHKVIIEGKIFCFRENNDGTKSIRVKIDDEDKDEKYYFELPEIHGVILRNFNGAYGIKAHVIYANKKGEQWHFAKVKISLGFKGNIEICGNRTGSWQQSDYYDTDFL